MINTLIRMTTYTNSKIIELVPYKVFINLKLFFNLKHEYKKKKVNYE
jgi:hypothetical protein